MWLHLAGYWVPGYLKEPRNVFFGGKGCQLSALMSELLFPLLWGFPLNRET